MLGMPASRATAAGSRHSTNVSVRLPSDDSQMHAKARHVDPCDGRAVSISKQILLGRDHLYGSRKVEAE